MYKKTKVVGMIPARLESSRLPGKVLIDIEGIPMVVHTCKRSMLAKSLDEVYLVTDNEKIESIGLNYGIKVIMTGRNHKTGSDRIAAACSDVECDIVVNIQGDEPLVNPEHIDKIVEPLIKDPNLDIAVGVTTYKRKNKHSDIKAVMDLEGNIMYCSREDIPSCARARVDKLLKMTFIVPFRKSFLIKYTNWEPTPLEMIEFNEYLRVLEHGIKLKAVEVDNAQISVDTPEDLEIVSELMAKDKIKKMYS